MTPNDVVLAWDCEAAGIVVTPGERITRRVLGTTDEEATIVGGAVTGLRPTSRGCTKLTTPGPMSRSRLLVKPSAFSSTKCWRLASPKHAVAVTPSAYP